MEVELEKVIATNVNNEPVVFRGCTTSEMMAVIGMSTIIVLPIFIIFGVVIGNIGLMIGAAMMGILAATVFGLSVLGAVKRNKPEGYYQHKLALFNSRYLGGRKSFVDVDGVMATERSKTTVLVKHHLGFSGDESIYHVDGE